jgi:hypothetical protein
MTRGLSRAAVAILLVGLVVPPAIAQVRRYAGRSLPDVLAEINREGLKLVFSSRVVTPEMRVRDEPKATHPRGIVEEILAPYGLCAVSGPGDRLLIVRAVAASGPAPADASNGPPPGAVSVGFRLTGGERLLAPSAVELEGEVGTATVAANGRILIRGLRRGLHYLETIVPGFVEPDARAFSLTPDGAVAFVIDLNPLPDTRLVDLTALPPVRLLVTAGMRHRETTEVSESARPADVGSQSALLPASALADAAGTVGNPLRAVQTLPGVGSAWAFDSRLVVRGGAPGENLFLVDGVESHSPYRAFGLASAFLPGALESIEMRPGGFDVRYGDRLSSVTLVNNRDGRRSGRIGGSAGIGLLDTDLLLEGALPGVSAGSFLVAARYSYYDLVTGSLLDDRMPRNVDVQAKVTLEPRAGHRLSMLAATGNERMESHEADDPVEDFTISTRSRAVAAAIRLDSTLGTRATLSTTASFNGVGDRFDYRGAVKTDARGTAAEAAVGDGAIADVVYDRTATVQDWAVRQDLMVSPSPRHTLDMGFDAHALATSWRWLVDGDRSEDVRSRMLPWPYAIPGANLPPQLDSQLGYSRVGAWVQYRPAVGWWLAPQVGLRLDHSGLTRTTDISPRVSATARLGPATRFTAAVGVYRQSPGYEKQFQSDYFVDLTHADRLRSERALHAVAGFERTLPAGVTVRVEAYRKWYTDLLVGRLETETERTARLARYDFGSLEAEAPGAYRVTTEPSNEGRGSASGFEVQVGKAPGAGNPSLAARASYSYGVATRVLYGHTVPFDYDRRHVLNLVASYQLRSSITLSGSICLASGLPYTAPVGLRVAARPDQGDRDGDGDRQELIPARDSAGSLIYALDFGDLSNVNGARLPNYARVDARVTFSPRSQHGRWSVYIDVINLFGRDNPGLIAYRVEQMPVGTRPVMTSEHDYSLPFLPSAGLRFRF